MCNVYYIEVFLSKLSLLQGGRDVPEMLVIEVKKR